MRSIQWAGNKINTLLDKSAGYLDIFTKTVQNLNEVNSQIEGAIQSREDQIKTIEGEKAILNSLKNDNTKIVEKLRKILE